MEYGGGIRLSRSLEWEIAVPGEGYCRLVKEEEQLQRIFAGLVRYMKENEL